MTSCSSNTRKKTSCTQPRLMESEVAQALERRDYPAVCRALANLRGPVDAFFDQVLVMAEDANVRRNRLALLVRISQTFLQMADFSRITTHNMRRWFRRKGKDTTGTEENGAAPLVEETESSPEAAGIRPPGRSGPASSKPAPPEAAAPRSRDRLQAPSAAAFAPLAPGIAAGERGPAALEAGCAESGPFRR